MNKENLAYMVPEFNIERTAEETRTNIFAPLVPAMETWLHYNGEKYEIYGGDGIPDDWIHGHVCRGRARLDHTAVLVTHLNSEQLFQIAEKMVEVPDQALFDKFGITELYIDQSTHHDKGDPFGD